MGDDRRRKPVVEPLSVARSVLQHEQQSGNLCAGQPSRSALAVRHRAGRARHRQCRPGRAISARHRLVEPVALCLYQQFRADRFADQVLGAHAMPGYSSLPRSAAIIDEFVYDPTTGTGELAMSAAHGVMRFIGGRLSKNEKAVSLLTPTGVLAVRGGIFLASVGSTGTDVTFLYGQGLTVSNPAGTQLLTRPGYMVTISSRNTPPSEPRPAPPGATAALLSQLDGRSGGTGGAQRTPTDQTVVTSGIATTISGNVMANVLAATQAAVQ